MAVAEVDVTGLLMKPPKGHPLHPALRARPKARTIYALPRFVGVGVLGGEADGVFVGGGAGGADGFAEGAVFVSNQVPAVVDVVEGGGLLVGIWYVIGIAHHGARQGLGTEGQ